MSTLKFYDCSTAPSPRRVRIFIAEKGLEIPVVEVDLATSQQHTEEFARINPHRTVPVLELDDGTTVNTGSGIMHYLEALHPVPALIGRNAIERGRVVDLDARIEQEGFMAIGEAFRNRSKAFANNVFTGKHNHRQIPELVERGRRRAEEFFAWMDDHLQDNEFIVGDAFSLADITAVVTVDFAKWIKLQPTPEQKHLCRWHQLVSGRQSVNPVPRR